MALTAFGKPLDEWGPDARLAIETLAMRPTRGIPHMAIHVMEIQELEHFSGRAPYDYLKNPEGVYLDFQRAFGTNAIDQYIPRNPLTMGSHGFESNKPRTATTGAEEIVLDGICIDSPEAVIEHLERFVWLDLRRQIAECNPDAPDAPAEYIRKEYEVQKTFGSDMLKIPYDGFGRFPTFRYGTYGYTYYFMAYALYPEVMERDFALQADLAEKLNRVAARAYVEGNLPKVKRLDHDMADSRGTLVRIETLDRIWFPHFARSVRPLLDVGIRLLWHCDGNLSQMVPRLIEAGVSGFQGFQYEDNMDYEKICRMTDRNGNPLMIWAGVSVTKTLPFGTPEDVRNELKWLVRHAPPVGFFLGASSSITPGVPRRNLEALREGLVYYQQHGKE